MVSLSVRGRAWTEPESCMVLYVLPLIHLHSWLLSYEPLLYFVHAPTELLLLVIKIYHTTCNYVTHTFFTSLENHFESQGQFKEPLLAAKTGPPDHFWRPQLVRGTSFGGDQFWRDRSNHPATPETQRNAASSASCSA